MSTTGGTAAGRRAVLDPPDVIRKKFKTAVTDSGRDVRHVPDEKPGVSNLIEILSVATRRADRRRSSPRYDGRGLRPVQGRRRRGGRRAASGRSRSGTRELRADEAELRRLLARRRRARRAETSAPTLERMYERMGFVRP